MTAVYRRLFVGKTDVQPMIVASKQPRKRPGKPDRFRGYQSEVVLELLNFYSSVFLNVVENSTVVFLAVTLLDQRGEDLLQVGGYRE